MLSAAADRNPNGAAIVSCHQLDQYRAPLYWTYAELKRKSESLAGSLKALGHTPKGPVVILLGNQVEWALLFWTSARLGSPLVPLSPRSIIRPDEVKHMLMIAGASVLVAANEDQATKLKKFAPEILRDIPIKIIVACGSMNLPSFWNFSCRCFGQAM